MMSEVAMAGLPNRPPIRPTARLSWRTPLAGPGGPWSTDRRWPRRHNGPCQPSHRRPNPQHQRRRQM